MTLPASPATGNIDAASDDPKLARADLKANWDKFDQIITHLNGSDVTKEPLTPGNGLQKNLTELEVQLQAAPGLKVEATGLAVDIAGATAETGPVAGDTVLFHDASAGALRKATITNMGKGLALTDIGNVSAGSPSTNDALIWNGAAWVSGTATPAAASVTQSKLKTTTETKTITPNPTTVDTTLASTYTLGMDVKNSNNALNHFNVLQTSSVNYVGNSQVYNHGTSFTTHLLLSFGTPSATLSARFRYVQASPPYDLGDGEVPLFIFLAMKADGTIGFASISEDPPWAGNGPTDIVPDFVDPRTGKTFKKRPTGPLFTLDEIRRDPGKRSAHIDSLRRSRDNNAFELVEITNDMKNADMALIPHPMLGHSDDAAPMVRVLIDPMSKEAEELLFLSRAGEDVGQIVQDYWTIDNVGLPRGKPSGVLAVRGRWKP